MHSTISVVNMQFCVAAIDISGSENYYPLVIALVQVVHEKDTTAP
jgi:hypothetical protein